MYLVINSYTNSDGEQFINSVVAFGNDSDAARRYMKEYAFESLREYENAGTLESIVERNNSITIKAKYSTDYFELCFINC